MFKLVISTVLIVSTVFSQDLGQPGFGVPSGSTLRPPFGIPGGPMSGGFGNHFPSGIPQNPQMGMNHGQQFGLQNNNPMGQNPMGNNNFPMGQNPMGNPMGQPQNNQLGGFTNGFAAPNMMSFSPPPTGGMFPPMGGMNGGFPGFGGQGTPKPFNPIDGATPQPIILKKREANAMPPPYGNYKKRQAGMNPQTPLNGQQPGSMGQQQQPNRMGQQNPNSMGQMNDMNRMNPSGQQQQQRLGPAGIPIVGNQNMGPPSNGNGQNGFDSMQNGQGMNSRQPQQQQQSNTHAKNSL
jgi:hypothetical protein